MSEELYMVAKRIVYHNDDHEKAHQIVEVGEYPEGLPFPHLSEGNKRLLVRKGILVPLTEELKERLEKERNLHHG